MLIDALRRCGARAVEREGERYVALFPPPADVDALVSEVRSALRASTSLTAPEVGVRWQAHDEWAGRWRSEQAARRVSDRIIVAPVGVDVTAGSGLEVGEDDVVVRLDPGVAFGTAEHATTRACLAVLDARLRPGDTVLDVGAGSGILSIAAARLGARRALALESDPLVCEAARRNVAVNGATDRVEVRQREVRAGDLSRLGRHDGVVVNIEARVSLPLVPALPSALVRNGWAALSGLVGDERTRAIDAAAGAGLEVVEERLEGGWWTGVLTRR